jgi:hypothetical protein
VNDAAPSLAAPFVQGLNHADMTADLTRMVVSCEFSGQLEVLDADATRVLKLIDLTQFLPLAPAQR